jgi:hypothetical protein
LDEEDDEFHETIFTGVGSSFSANQKNKSPDGHESAMFKSTTSRKIIGRIPKTKAEKADVGNQLLEVS